MRRRASRLGASLGLVTPIAACGIPAPAATTPADLFQAWSATPLAVAPAMAQQALAVRR